MGMKMNSILCFVFLCGICRPGDHVLWKTEDIRRHVIVQSVNSSERVAQVRFARPPPLPLSPTYTITPPPTLELVSVLELDPHGGSDWSSSAPVEGLGLHRGEFVFIHRAGTTNGAEAPMVPRIGELEAWVRESPLGQVQEGGWRRAMVEIGNGIAARRGKESGLEEGVLRRPGRGDHVISWFGEVVDVSPALCHTLLEWFCVDANSIFFCVWDSFDWMGRSSSCSPTRPS